MLSSTFVVLRLQGIDTACLQSACIAHFRNATPFDIAARDLFWKEFIRSRRAYRAATHEDVEQVLASA